MKRFLITRPHHDSVVSYLYAWSEEIIYFAQENNVPYTDFKKEKANKEEVEKFLAKQKPSLVVFNGHGSSKSIAGHKNEVLICATENEKLLTSTITYAVACDAAAQLGESIIKEGGIAFIGYRGPFGFAHQPSRECTPGKDLFAQPFKQASNEIIISLLKGHTVNEAYEKSQKTFSKLMQKYSASDADKESQTIRFWLFWDKYFQTIHGNKEALF